MRVYFLSYIPAILKLNGIFVGTIDGFERHIELETEDNVFAEIVPDDNLQSVNFFLNGEFFKNPPPFADVYLMDGDALVFIREYFSKDVRLKVIYQTRFCGNLVTVFSQGGVYLSVEGREYSLTPLPLSFMNTSAEQKSINGKDVLALYGGENLVIISDSGNTVFSNPAEKADFGDMLTVTSALGTCTLAKAECDFSYDGEKLTLVSSRTTETRPLNKNILQFAFFESVLTRSDYKKYLHDSIKQRADDIISYLGDFVSVAVPPEKFYNFHPNLNCAGLIYPKSANLYEVKFFAVDIEDGLISNIYPVNQN